MFYFTWILSSEHQHKLQPHKSLNKAEMSRIKLHSYSKLSDQNTKGKHCFSGFSPERCLVLLYAKILTASGLLFDVHRRWWSLKAADTVWNLKTLCTKAHVKSRNPHDTVNQLHAIKQGGAVMIRLCDFLFTTKLSQQPGCNTAIQVQKSEAGNFWIKTFCLCKHTKSLAL